MSRAGATPPGLGEDARFELAMTASAQEKRNRPTGLLIGAVLILVACGVFASWSVLSRNGARHERKQAVADAAAVERLAKEWQDLASQERDAPQTQGGGRINDLLTRMERLATEAGLKDRPQNPQSGSQTTTSGIVVNEYTYRGVKDASLNALMQWVRQATTQIPGMEVTELILKPDATSWTMDVVFRRWERPG